MLVMQRPTVEAIGEESDNRQRFAVGPLEPGFGHTLGNSLRRTLLSSIPGAAITMVRFDDALHEFDTIAGVAEDVTDIILNLKDVVVTSESSDPVTCRLDVRGRGRRSPPATSSARPTSRSSTRTSSSPRSTRKGRLAIDLTVEQGRGYSLERPRDREPHDRRHPDRRHLLAGAPGRRSRSSRPASSSRRTTTASSSTSRPTARSRRARRSPRPARRCARSPSSSRR